MRRLPLILTGIGLLSCGSDPTDESSVLPTDPPKTTGGDPARDAGHPTKPVDYTASVWDVNGTDARGAFTGHVEMVADAGALRFTRVVHYTTARVEDARELWWVWQGKAAAGSGGALAIDVALRKLDFVVERGALKRTASDASPVSAKATFARSPKGFTGTYQVEGAAITEEWSPSTVEGPIFAGVDRTFAPSHDPPDPTTKAALFAEFTSFHALPKVAPYTKNAAFKGAQHGFEIDKTDLDFYRAHPDALRVIDKVVDPISLLETLARANAYRWPMHQKAALFDTEIRQFVDTTGFLGTSFDVAKNRINPSGDGALWAGVYVATQAYRFWTTNDPVAKTNARATFEGLIRLQPVTGDKTTFARVLRPAGYGPLTGGWHAGTGTFSDVEWKEGGNNDMLKGLFIGYLVGWKLFCKSGGGSDPACARLVQNARDLADSVAVADDKTNKLKSTWLAAVVTGDLGYRVAATQEWITYQPIVERGTLATFEQGIADWSGTHLGFWDFETMFLLAEELDLANVKPSLSKGVKTAATTYERARLALWDLARSARSETGPHPASLASGKLRMTEIACPKPTGGAVDHSRNPDWVISPYPALFWKNDWTTEDRTQALVGVPLFEGPGWTSTVWKANTMGYDDQARGVRYNGIDYLTAYWYGRRYGLISATE